MTGPFGDNEFYNITNAQPDKNGLIECAVLPLHGTVIYPNVASLISITTSRAAAAAEAAFRTRHTVIGLAQRDLSVDDPVSDDLYNVGTEIALGQTLKMPDGSQSVLVQGRRRVQVVEVAQTNPYIIVTARLLPDRMPTDDTRDTKAMMQAVTNLFKRVVELSMNIPDEAVVYALNTDDPAWLADLITSTLTLPLEERQRILEITDVHDRLHEVATLLGQELTALELKDEISSQVQMEMDREQREVYLREQMRVIQTELGEEDIYQQEITEVREQIEQAALPGEVHEKAMKELSRLAMMPPMAPEVGMVRAYIDWLTAVPWSKESDDNLDVAHAERILEEEHYGLRKTKDRILEYIAVRRLAEMQSKAKPDRSADDDNLSNDLDKVEARKTASPVLCFVGPPGVGKTSMGKSIADALGREFIRVSLGGVRDEAEIRGHRRTYIGALPGRIIQTMRRAGTINPVFVLDEIDKLGSDFRGDPAAALLEVLDPEQNYAYSDHYLDVPYNLSKVLFITTANDLDPLPPALLDRLEVIEFSGYTEEEKITIARRFLIPRQIEAHSLTGAGIDFTLPALQELIRKYTYEAGVRNLNREIANVCRKIARLVVENKRYPKRVTAAHINKLLGPPYYDDQRVNEEDTIGVATGMAWTPFGGETLTIEVSVLPGKGNLMMTGQLGDVMQESAQAALSYMRARADDLDVPYEDFENTDVHVHLPEGSVPKEGPSAGITLAAAIISAFTERKIRSDFAMTGEITLRGKVLPVGGVKEKLLAVRSARVKNVILPAQNERDLVDVPKEALRDLKIHLVNDMQEVIDLVLLEPPPEGRRRDLMRQDKAEDKAEAVSD